jgi:hypothetical protein
MSIAQVCSTGLAMQGFKLSQEEEAKLAIPIRFAPTMCMLFTAAFTVLQMPQGMYAIAVIAGLAAILPRHPFDYLYAAVINPILKTGTAPPTTPQRRFSCGFGSLMLAYGGYSFATGNVLMGQIMGFGFAGLVIPMITIHFCMASWMYNYIPGLPNRWLGNKGGQADRKAA